jgi:hypothetical protein
VNIIQLYLWRFRYLAYFGLCQRIRDWSIRKNCEGNTDLIWVVEDGGLRTEDRGRRAEVGG